MRNGDVLPFTVIITGIGKFRIIFTRKFPPFFESLLCLRTCACIKAKQQTAPNAAHKNRFVFIVISY